MNPLRMAPNPGSVVHPKPADNWTVIENGGSDVIMLTMADGSTLMLNHKDWAKIEQGPVGRFMRILVSGCRHQRPDGSTALFIHNRSDDPFVLPAGYLIDGQEIVGAEDVALVIPQYGLGVFVHDAGINEWVWDKDGTIWGQGP